MSLEETYTFSGAGCLYPLTASQTLEVGGVQYTAIPQTFDPQPTPFPVVYHYPNFTIGAVTPYRQITFVCPVCCFRLIQAETFHGESVPGGGTAT